MIIHLVIQALTIAALVIKAQLDIGPANAVIATIAPLIGVILRLITIPIQIVTPATAETVHHPTHAEDAAIVIQQIHGKSCPHLHQQ